MAVDSKHPDYSFWLQDWKLMEDTFSGSRTVKEQGFTYLPPTPAQIERGVLDAANTDGGRAYAAYVLRSVFPDFISETSESMVGTMHNKPVTIELPPQLEPMRDNATTQGESLEILLRRINEQQLITGRTGLLLDVPSDQGPQALPYIAQYAATTIINWDDGSTDELVKQNLNLVVLDETEPERKTDFSWANITKYRVLILGDIDANVPENEGTYQVSVFRNDGGEDGNISNLSISDGDFIAPSIKGQTLDKIPFVFVNSKDIVPTPTSPPLLGLANLALTVYRGEADYRGGLFQQGQDTLVVIGGNGQEEDEGYNVGAGSFIEVEVGGDAKFIGVNGLGLPESRMSLENDRKEAADLSGRLIDNQGSGNEASGKALSIRVATRTANMKQIALTSAEALEQILKIAAEWVGANPDDVRVIPNTDFVEPSGTPQDMVHLQSIANSGGPLCQESVHGNLVENGYTKKTFEEEQECIAQQEPVPEGDNGI